MTALTFDVPGPPVRWRRAGRNGKRTFTFPECEAYKERVAYAGLMALKLVDGWGAIRNATYHRLTVHVVPLAPVKPTGREERRGDWDNYGKIVSDALNGIVWDDDKSVINAHVVVYQPSRRPGIRVTVQPWQRMPWQDDEHQWPEVAPERARRKR